MLSHKHMAFTAITASFLILLSLFIAPSLCDVSPSAHVDPSAACNSTQDPNFCRSVVLPLEGCSNLYDYGRLSLAKSLSNAESFHGMVYKYLSDRYSELSQTAILALQDCLLLSGLNIDFLISAGATLNYTDYLVDAQAEEFQTLLSALLTNHQTCHEGLKATASAWFIENWLAVPLTNSSKLYSVSLALYNKAWIGKRKLKSQRNFSNPQKVIPSLPKRRSLLFHEVNIGEDGRLPLRMIMSGSKSRLFESKMNSRRQLLLQTTDTVLVMDIVVVSKDGTGDFTTISDAVASAPSNLNGNNGYYLIYIVAGIYNEYVSIPKSKMYLMMIGDGINRTVITGSHSVGDGWTTFNSATFVVIGQGFVGINITFRNTAGAAKGQAVAVRNGADLSAFYSCSFEGYQDTLYAHSLRQFYKQCHIYGTVDFIFGNAAAVFQGCNIYARLPLRGQADVVTAQGRSDPNQNTGTTMQGCRFLAAPDLRASPYWPSTKTYLGRPWQMYSRVVILQSYMDGVIAPAGWTPWSGSFALSTLYFAEYGNFGPGSATGIRVSWPGFHVLDWNTASRFTVSSFLLGDNWLPQNGVPYSSGMLW